MGVPPRRQLAAYLAIIVFAAAVLCLPLFLYGAPNGHSIEYNLVWLREFSQQLLAGDVYPRWLVDMNRGAGSPVFFFYGSLPFYIASAGALLCPSCKLVVQLGIGEWLLIALSGVAFFLFARRRFGALPALLAALLYLCLPYHFEIDLWRRQAIGELATYIWMPLIALHIDRLADGEDAVGGLALCYALLLFSHLPTALLFSLCLGAYIAVRVGRAQWRWFLPRCAGAIGLGCALAGIYLVPALFADQYIDAAKLWTPYFDFHHWFFPGTQAPDQHFGGRLYPLLALTGVMFALLWLDAWRTRRDHPEVALWPWLALAGAAWFLMTPLSLPVWEHAPVLWQVQFPWRAAIALDFATAATALFALRGLCERRDLRSAAVLAAVAVLMVYCLYSGRDVVRNLDTLENSGYIAGRDAAVERGVDAPEYTTVWSKTAADDPRGEIAGMPRLRFDTSHGQALIAQWQPRRIELAVKLHADTELQVRQFYFPGWHARIDGREQPLVLGPSVPSGLLRIAAPAGEYTIELELEPLLQEKLGAALSALALLLLGLRTRRYARWRRHWRGVFKLSGR